MMEVWAVPLFFSAHSYRLSGWWLMYKKKTASCHCFSIFFSVGCYLSVIYSSKLCLFIMQTWNLGWSIGISGSSCCLQACHTDDLIPSALCCPFIPFILSMKQSFDAREACTIEPSDAMHDWSEVWLPQLVVRVNLRHMSDVCVRAMRCHHCSTRCFRCMVASLLRRTLADGCVLEKSEQEKKKTFINLKWKWIVL